MHTCAATTIQHHNIIKNLSFINIYITSEIHQYNTNIGSTIK
jgi:hypothetical protein